MLQTDTAVDEIPLAEDEIPVDRFQLYRVRDENVRTAPRCLQFSSPISSIDFHPDRDLVLVSCADGCVSIFDYSEVSNVTSEGAQNLHAGFSCNRSQFTDDGRSVLSVGSDRAIRCTDVESGRLCWEVLNSHEVSVETCLQCDGPRCVTGDFGGCIKLWDFRLPGGSGSGSGEAVAVAVVGSETPSSVNSWSNHTDAITKFDFDENRKMLLASSLDGRLSVTDLRNSGRFVDMSGYTLNDASYVDFVLCNHGGHVVCATDDGALDLYFYGRWGRPGTRMRKHRDKRKIVSFEGLCFLKEELMAGVHSNGYMGLYDVSRPDTIKHIGGLGRFNSIRLSKVALASDGKFLATADEEFKVRFWHSSFLFKGTRWWEDCEYYVNEKKSRKRKRDESSLDLRIIEQVRKRTKFNSKQKRFFADLTPNVEHGQS